MSVANGPWPPRGFGLELVAEYEAPPPVYEDWAEWAQAYPGGRDDELPPLPRTLPIIPVNVRLFRSEHVTDGGILDAFAGARAFWLERACIELRLEGERVWVVEDEDRSLEAPSNAREALEAVHTPNAGWLTVLYVDRLTNSQTLFRVPSKGHTTYGIVATEATAYVLAHEIGHALGLSHPAEGNNQDTDEAVFGMPYTSFCLRPFEDDILGLPRVLEASNLMNDRLTYAPADLSARWMSRSQVERARLTVVSRQCPYSRFDETGLLVGSPGQVLIDDITAAFTAETIPGHHRYPALPSMPK